MVGMLVVRHWWYGDARALGLAEGGSYNVPLRRDKFSPCYPKTGALRSASPNPSTLCDRAVSWPGCAVPSPAFPWNPLEQGVPKCVLWFICCPWGYLEQNWAVLPLWRITSQVWRSQAGREIGWTVLPLRSLAQVSSLLCSSRESTMTLDRDFSALFLSFLIS
jgi:hypothetical protein